MDNQRTNYASGTQWEAVVGYSRAVRVGRQLEISGTVAVDETGQLIGEGDAYLQAKFIIQKMEAVLLQAGGTLKDVVRTRIFITDMSFWLEVAHAHSEAFGTIRPATSMLAVAALIDPRYLVEIEITAILPQ